MVSYSWRFAYARITVIFTGLIVVLIGITPDFANRSARVIAQAATPTSSATVPLSPGTERTDPTGIKQVWVPAGCFMMGSTADQIEEAYTQARKLDSNARMNWFTMESPQHETCLTEGYWIDKYDVTNAAFEMFVEAGGYNNDQFWSVDGLAWKRENNVSTPGKRDWNNRDCRQNFDDPQRPRVCITWYEAEAYANWRTETANDGLSYRLPTEAEWEYTARGPESRIYPWGNTFDNKVFNFCDKNCPTDYADKSVDDGYAYTSPIDHYAAGASWVNAYDMAGNVWQWTTDCYDPSFYNHRPNPDNNPINSCSDNSPRVIRGGSWDHNQVLARSASRGGADPLQRYNNFGFRLIASGSSRQ